MKPLLLLTLLIAVASGHGVNPFFDKLAKHVKYIKSKLTPPEKVSHTYKSHHGHKITKPSTSKKTYSAPSFKPHSAPSIKPYSAPSVKPHSAPSAKPHSAPSAKPLSAPSVKPHSAPSVKSHSAPSAKPHSAPSVKPHSAPLVKSHSAPSVKPHSLPSVKKYSASATASVPSHLPRTPPPTPPSFTKTTPPPTPPSYTAPTLYRHHIPKPATKTIETDEGKKFEPNGFEDIMELEVLLEPFVIHHVPENHENTAENTIEDSGIDDLIETEVFDASNTASQVVDLKTDEGGFN